MRYLVLTLLIPLSLIRAGIGPGARRWARE
jgi:hypothetical protein